MCNNYKNELLNKEDFINYQTEEVLDLERVSQLRGNAMLKVRPDLWCEWDFEKNNELGHDIWKMTKGINAYKVWWNCPSCKSDFDANINNRNHNNNCPYCAGKKVNRTNSLVTLNPKLASQWHPTLNGELTPHDVTVGSSKQKVWWLGDCGHFWDARIADRANGRNCPYCSNQKVLVGFNDMWTTNPELAKLLANPEDGYKYMKTSHKKVNWVCGCCNEVIEDRDIRQVSYNGVPCPNCSDGIFFPEKVVYYALKNLNLNFTWQKIFSWAKNKRYDFFINDINEIVIEVHGGQHSVDRGFERSGWKTIEEVIQNDQLKEKLALENEIKNYIVIDARYSDFDYIKNNLINSGIFDFYELSEVDWDWVHSKSASSMVFEASKLWNTGQHNVKEISTILKIDRNKTARLLNSGNKLGICEYDMISNKGSSVKVVQLSLDGIYIETYKSMTDACIKNNFKKTVHASISKCCLNKQKQTHGYRWMYLSEYEKMIEEQNKIS